MNGLSLKLIAMFTMLIDHATAQLIPGSSPLWFIGRSIGRLAFPIFCFLLVEGFLHTRSVRNYLIRLGIFAMISEIPFDIAFIKGENFIDNLSGQNIYFTLFIGLFVILLIQLVENKYRYSSTMTFILTIIIILTGCQLAEFLRTDYGAMGILMIVCFYLFRNNKWLLLLTIFLVNQTILSIQGFGTISLLFIWLYNGERGPKLNKYIFYAFYPVHILILHWISTVI
ncbi:conjugal transfer protein TraX [Anaerocolumna aminovalerica]|uniref:TraX family protein n=1 Tax=Anaerocolumna aminovalerica TaxID=1527 RepID=UPI001C0EFEAF|nr:conjugal transfer protein TraX [Anaerocolumna aminovalerica]